LHPENQTDQIGNRVSFLIGDSHLSVADDTTKALSVYENGHLVRTMPTSMGMGGTETIAGRKVSVGPRRRHPRLPQPQPRERALVLQLFLRRRGHRTEHLSQRVNAPADDSVCDHRQVRRDDPDSLATSVGRNAAPKG
jgi:hypothetical protein